MFLVFNCFRIAKCIIAVNDETLHTMLRQCFIQDLMHVFHKGILNTSCALLLKQLIEDKEIKLNIEYINNKIASIKMDREHTTPTPSRSQEIKFKKNVFLVS